MKKLFTIIFLTTILFAGSGDKKIKIIGSVNDSAPKYTTAKLLEQNFKIFKKEVYNSWEKRSDLYEGVFLNDLAKKYGTKDTKQIKLIALDGYNIDYSKELYESQRILLSFKVNGKYISIKDKGPMRVVFVDFDSSKKSDNDNLHKWMWMIKKIEFK